MTGLRRLLHLFLLVLVPISITGIAGFGTALADAKSRQPNFIIHDSPKVLPALTFQDGDDREMNLRAFHGKFVLLNIWATWCPPCRKEMPTLDRLQAALGGAEFQVVALSMDRGGKEKVRKFFDKIGIQQLSLYVDTSGKAARTLGAFGLPVTLLVNPQGQEIGRLVGPAEWDTPEMVEFLKGIMAPRKGASDPSKPSLLLRFAADSF